MKFLQAIQNNTLIITLQDENLDTMNASSFKNEIIDLLEKTNCVNVIFDLGQLKFIDSSGLRAFLTIQRFLNQKDGIIKLAQLNPNVKSILEIVSIHQIFEIFSKVEEALESK